MTTTHPPTYKLFTLLGKPITINGRPVYYNRSRDEFSIEERDVLRPPDDGERGAIAALAQLGARLADGKEEDPGGGVNPPPSAQEGGEQRCD